VTFHEPPSFQSETDARKAVPTTSSADSGQALADRQDGEQGTRMPRWVCVLVRWGFVYNFGDLADPAAEGKITLWASSGSGSYSVRPSSIIVPPAYLTPSRTATRC
jgi:hypothetical protein